MHNQRWFIYTFQNTLKTETVFADMEIGIGEGQMKIFISDSG